MSIFKRALDVLIDREVIGHPDCPLMLRWTFFERFGYKAMVHYFPPGVDDEDPHDHPRSFLTFVIRGEYMDQHWEPSGECPIEMVKAPAIRFRAADYMHIVETPEGPGCWTIVVMGPVKRPWGFFRLNGSKWWPWERYVQNFGGTVRCDTDDGNREHELKRSAKPERWRATDFPD